MRPLIIVSASREMVMEPSSTWATNSLTKSLPRSLEPGSLESRPSSTIWSSRLRSTTCSCACGAALCFASAIGTSLRFIQLLLQLVQLGLVSDCAEQQLLQLVIALEAAAQIAQPGAKLHQLAQGFHLAGDVLRLEVVHALEVQVDLKLRAVRVFAQLIFDGEREVRLHPLEDAVKVIRIDL